MTHKQLARKVKNEGKVKGICLDVFEILCESPGLTGGEIFMKYKKRYPRTKRGRNELAKRVTDLRHMGAVRARGMAYCPLTNKYVTRWFPTGQKPVRQKSEVGLKGLLGNNETTEDRPVTPIPKDTGPIVPFNCTAAQVAGEANEQHTRMLKALAGRCKVVLAFRWFLLPGYKRRTREVLEALEYAIEKCQ
jgi:hypothetical protein